MGDLYDTGLSPSDTNYNSSIYDLSALNSMIDITPNYTPPGTYAGVPSSSVDWAAQAANWITVGINKIAAPVLNSQFGGPQPGQYMAYNPKTGQYTAYALPSGSASAAFSDFTSTSGSTWLVIGGILLAVLMFSSMGKK